MCRGVHGEKTSRLRSAALWVGASLMVILALNLAPPRRLLAQAEPPTSLAERLEKLGEATPQQQRATYEQAKRALSASRLGSNELQIARTIAKALESAGNKELAAEAYTTSGMAFAKLSDGSLALSGKKMIGAGRRLQLPGNEMEIAGTTVRGQSFHGKVYQGKVVLVDFWATWCGPCIGELPNVKKNYEKYHGKGFEIIAVSLDSDRSKLMRFIQEEQLPWVCLFQDDAGWNHPLAVHYGINSIPQAILIDQQGKVVSMNARGPRLGDQLERLLASSGDGSQPNAVRVSKASAESSEEIVIPDGQQQPIHRTWTDRSGKYSIDATFTKFEKGRVFLKSKTGDEISLAVGQLSPVDQRWVRDELKRQRGS